MIVKCESGKQAVYLYLRPAEDCTQYIFNINMYNISVLQISFINIPL